MSRSGIIISIGLLLAAGLCCAEESTEPSPVELAAGVWGFLAVPEDVESCPGIILLHGASGWRPVLADLATGMADSGFVVLALDYYAEAGASPIGSARLEKWADYSEAVRKAAAYMESMPIVSGNPIGLVGFSRGAFLAVSVSSSIPRVGAVVDFYGGGGGGFRSVEEEAEGLPPILILHGEEDGIVPVSFAEALRKAALSAGVEVEIKTYPGAGHAFNLPSTRGYSREATLDSYRRTMDFLDRWLRSY
jgi:carboxymethylenebutenolidase